MSSGAVSIIIAALITALGGWLASVYTQRKSTVSPAGPKFGRRSSWRVFANELNKQLGAQYEQRFAEKDDRINYLEDLIQVRDKRIEQLETTILTQQRPGADRPVTDGG